MVRKNSLMAMLSVSALALLVAAAPAFAAEVDVRGENHRTGADSDNENRFDVRHDIDIDVRNDGDVENRADADVNTGGNNQNRNTEAGDIDSGDIDASTDWESIVNTGAALMGSNSHGGLEVMADFSNDTTGADSDNENRLDVRNDVEVDVRNIADILNRLRLDANTGDNTQTRNTEAGDIETGDIELDSSIVNEANNDSGFMGSAVGTTSVEVDAENRRTGADSDNENRVIVRNDVDIDVRNNADIENRIRVDANTGNNTQNRNTTAGDIETGDVEVSTDIVNEANNGSSIGGSSHNNGLEVAADFSNDTTGANSDNENRLDVRNDVEIDVRNNADVENRLNVDANTGNNTQSRNTTAGGTSTGSVSIDFGSFTVVNSN